MIGGKEDAFCDEELYFLSEIIFTLLFESRKKFPFLLFYPQDRNELFEAYKI